MSILATLAPAAVPAAMGVLAQLPSALAEIDDTYDWVYEETMDKKKAAKAAGKAAARALGRALLAGSVAGAGGLLTARISRSLGHLVGDAEGPAPARAGRPRPRLYSTAVYAI